MLKEMRFRAFPAVLALAALATAAQAQGAPAYTLVKTVPLGAPDRWDYVVADPATSRVYIAHGDRLAVLDAASGDVVGEVDGMPGGTHGTAISTATHQGFTDDGEKAEAVAFDLKTLKVIRRIPAADDADGMTRDPALRRRGRSGHADGDRPEDRRRGRDDQGRREDGISRRRPFRARLRGRRGA